MNALENKPATGHHAVQANADAAQARGASSLAQLFAGHVLQDGEIVLLVLKPSLWFILLSGLRFIAIVLILMIAGFLFGHVSRRTLQELGIFLVAGRLMWSILQWMGRVYVLTDLRIVRLSGVFNVEIYDCPLRKVSRTRILRSMRERISSTGTIEINSSSDSCATGYWNTVSRPIEVHDQIVAAINRAKNGN